MKKKTGKASTKRKIVRDSSRAKDIGERIARLRIAHDLTQTQLAKETGLAQNIVSDLERGRTRLNADILILLADKFHVSTDEILGRSEQDSEQAHISKKILRRAIKLESLPRPLKVHILRTIDMLLKAASE